jgi:hypothetical protein
MVIMQPKLNPGIIIRKEKDFGIMFDVNKDREEFFNEIGIDILTLSDGEHELSQMVDILEKSYEADRKQIEKDLLEFITEQNEEGVISLED